MLSIDFTYSHLLLLLGGALALPACTFDKVLGETAFGDSSSDSSTGSTTDAPATDGTSSSTTDEPTTGDGVSPICTAPGGGDPGGTLDWSLSGGDLEAGYIGIAVNPNGELILAGNLSEPGLGTLAIETRKPDGTVKWQNTYASESGLGIVALGAVLDGDGWIYVLARETITSVTEDTMGTYDARLVVLHYAANGDFKWRWQQDHPPVEEWHDYTPSGQIVVVGDTVHVLAQAFDEPTVVFKLNEDDAADEGSVALDVPEQLGDRAVAFAPEGEVYVAGNLEYGPGQHALWVGRFGLDGGLVWDDQFGSLDDKPTSLVAGPEGDVVMAWSTSLPGGIENHLRRYDAAGAELWTAPLPPVGLDSGALVGALRCDGVVLLAGGSDRPVTPDSEWGARREMWVGAYSLAGAELWSVFHPFGEVDSLGDAYAIAADWNGDAIVGGAYSGFDQPGGPWLGRFAGG